MPRYMIEVEHENSKKACEYAQRTFYRTGSHFITNAEWGCPDDVHKAWMIVELDSKEEALQILPPDFRQAATVIKLERIDPDNIEDLVHAHGG